MTACLLVAGAASAGSRSRRRRTATLRGQAPSSSPARRIPRIWIRRSSPTAKRSGSRSRCSKGLVELGPARRRSCRRSRRSWKLAKGGKVWTFNLRKGVKFHDGTPLNAAAVCANFNRWYNFSGPFQDAVGDVLLPGDLRRVQEERGRDLSAPLFRSCTREGRDTDRRQAGRAVGSVLPVARDPVVRDAEPDGDEEVRRRPGHAPDGAFRATGSYAFQHPTGTGPFKFQSWHDRPEGRARPERELLGPEGEAGQDHHPADLGQHGARPGAADG